MKKVVLRPLHPILCPLAARSLKYKSTKVNQSGLVNDLLKFVYSFNSYGIGIAPVQVLPEIASLLRILQERSCSQILEIGTASGGTLYLFSQVMPSNGKLISIDLPGGRFGGGYPAWKTRLYKGFVSGDQKMHLIRGNSHDVETFHT